MELKQKSGSLKIKLREIKKIAIHMQNSLHGCLLTQRLKTEEDSSDLFFTGRPCGLQVREAGKFTDLSLQIPMAGAKFTDHSL